MTTIFYVWQHYEQPDKLSRIDAGEDKDTPDVTGVAEYTCFPTGAVKRKELGNGIQGMDYRYSMRGWLKMINQQGLGSPADGPVVDSNDRFGEIIGYHKFDHIADNTIFNAEKRYNGDIS